MYSRRSPKNQLESEENPKNQEPSDEEDYDPSEDEEDFEPSEGEQPQPEQEDAKPVGEVIQVTGRGKNKRSHYQAFEFDGRRFELEDSVLLSPEQVGKKPDIVIIKDITQETDGSMMVRGQCFYRPEKAEKKGGNWEGFDNRELFYSFHHNEVPAESVMHKCKTHFIPLHKQIPVPSVHPGFIVQKVYCASQKRLRELTDKHYEDSKQEEINILIEKTRQRLGELPDLVESEDEDREDHLKDRHDLEREDILPIDVSKELEEVIKSDGHLTDDTTGSPVGEPSEFYKILANFKALTGEFVRDKWLEKLLQAIKVVYDSNENIKDGDNDNGGSTSIDCFDVNNQLDATDIAQVRNPKNGERIHWPDDVVPAVIALEKAAHNAFDSKKINQKMRQMTFSLKGNIRLARRLINGELDASVVLYMSPTELKAGQTAQETKKPEESA